MQITVLSISSTTVPTAKGSYQKLEVAFKKDGEIKGKTLMSFGGSAPAFKVLSKAQPNEVYEVEAVKNDKDFWDWVSAKKSDGSVPAADTPTSVTPTAPAGKVVGSNYETKEERTAKQVFIVRQSSITAALSLIGMQGRKTGVTPKDVTEVAKEFEDFVFGKDQGPAAVPSPAAQDLLDMADDVPL